MKYTSPMQNTKPGSEINKVLHLVLDHMMGGVGLFEVGAMIKPLYYNPGLLRIIEDYTEEEMVLFHENALFNVFPEDAQAIQGLLLQSLQDGLPFETEYREPRKRGGFSYVQLKVARVPYEDSDCPVYLAIFNDITVHKEFQHQVEEERQRYKLAMETSNDIVFEYDIPADMYRSYECVTGDNAGLIKEEFSNYSRILRETPLAHPDDVEDAFFAFCQGKQCTSNLRLRRPADPVDTFRWFSIRTTLVYSSGVPVRVVGTLRNVDEQKLLASIIDSFVYETSDYFLFVDAYNDKYTIYSSSSNGTPLPRVECESYTQEVHDYAKEHVVERDVDYIIEAMSIKKVLEFLDKNSEYIIYVGVKDPVRGYTHKKLRYVYHDKQKKQILLTRTDVTHMYYEEERKNALLREALASAKSANCAKTDFLSRMSHDIRTPLNAIFGMTAIASRKIDDSKKVIDCLNKISTSSQYLLSLINAILDMAKIESGKLSLEESPFSLEKLLSDIKAIMYPQAQMQGVDFQINVTQPIATIFVGDSVRLNQIFMNLLSNSVKFTTAGGKVSLHVRELLRYDNTALMGFRVRDTGVGISAEFKEKMFDPFEQESSDYARSQVGSGLGLPIVKNFVELMGGTIEVESIMGTGTVVNIQLPMKIEESEPLHAAHFDLSRQSESHTIFAGENILLVEDNDINQEIAKVLLEEEGLSVECADNGQQALELFSRSPVGYYDLILMDIRMPVMDGITATRQLRQLNRADAPRIPVIAMTANAFAEDMHTALAAGMNGYLTKPVQPDTLYQEIANHFGSMQRN